MRTKLLLLAVVLVAGLWALAQLTPVLVQLRRAAL